MVRVLILIGAFLRHTLFQQVMALGDSITAGECAPNATVCIKLIALGFAMNADGVNLPALLENRGQQVCVRCSKVVVQIQRKTTKLLL